MRIEAHLQETKQLSCRKRKRWGEVKQVYKCDFCMECFSSEQEAKQHEEKCPCNPKNKIEDKTVFRLAMILYEFTDILATALTNHDEEKIPFVLGEFERADENNCPFMIHQEKGRALYALRRAKDIKRKREGLRTTKYEDVLKQYPELVNAIEQTLNRPAWNER